MKVPAVLVGHMVVTLTPALAVLAVARAPEDMAFGTLQPVNTAAAVEQVLAALVEGLFASSGAKAEFSLIQIQTKATVQIFI